MLKEIASTHDSKIVSSANGSKLSLPEGWTYSTRTLAEDFELDSGGLAYVINDDLYNAYQRRT